MFFKSCIQFSIALLLIIIGYVILYIIRGRLGLGFDWEKYNWWFDIFLVILDLSLIYLFCVLKFKVIPWILLGIMFLGISSAILNRTTVLELFIKN